MKTKEQKRAERLIDASRRIRGVERQQHFESGGSLAAWRGISSRTKNIKAAANKNACRNHNW